MPAFIGSGHSNYDCPAYLIRCFRPRLCENAVFIIMQRSQHQGQINEAFH